MAAGRGLPVHCCAPLELLLDDELLLEEELLLELDELLLELLELELLELLELEELEDELLLDEPLPGTPVPPHEAKSAMQDMEAELKIQWLSRLKWLNLLRGFLLPFSLRIFLIIG